MNRALRAPPITTNPSRPLFLASVRDRSEAEIAMRNDVDVIDMKEPSNGALGAVKLSELRKVIRFTAGRKPISATIGEPGMNPASMRRAVMERFDAGANYVKVGFPRISDVNEFVSTLPHGYCATHNLVAVLLADLEPCLGWLTLLRDMGFAGVMLDTNAKTSGSLCQHLSTSTLARFIDRSHDLGMFCGLAGSLQGHEVPRLLRLGPDLIGFRSALCTEGRSSTLDHERVRNVGRIFTAPHRGPSDYMSEQGLISYP
ncbi:(5-formylfuran-3-yl)methyl phosphate synthase [Thioalkalivibrio sp. ALJ2]|uniref:(5-formylfuran-3-yl)methyl phosphate synthase n=1 Tax=Thioalkalivibrio sp. ALJ2 TaxID=1261622 RepID=UPI0009D9192B|nr:(5-formylfuran-3-yl)methyl phosphate synthase [Thioalkalivibrio sp. ALJ2]